jgi:hypothetical protein
MAYEAMNHAGFLDKNMIIVLNDNQQVSLPTQYNNRPGPRRRAVQHAGAPAGRRPLASCARWPRASPSSCHTPCSCAACAVAGGSGASARSGRPKEHGADYILIRRPTVRRMVYAFATATPAPRRPRWPPLPMGRPPRRGSAAGSSAHPWPARSALAPSPPHRQCANRRRAARCSRSLAANATAALRRALPACPPPARLTRHAPPTRRRLPRGPR